MAEATAVPDGIPEDAEDISGDGGLCKRVLVEGIPGTAMPSARDMKTHRPERMRRESFVSS